MIYLDNNATTRVDPRVLDEMLPYLKDLYGNASSNHEFGHQMNEAVKKARKQVADLINASPHEIIFTSGATESINLAIKGLFEQKGHEKNHIITVQTEHSAVLDVCEYLETKGAEVTYLPVQSDGLIRLEDLQEAITDNTLFVSVMLVNNETGVIQDIEAVSKIAHDAGAFFMTDGTQAFGKMPIDVEKMGIDMIAFSAHKVHGPKGVGGLYVRSKRPFRVKLTPLIHGGGHERGMRSGTLNVPGIVGLGQAIEIAQNEMKENEKNIRYIRDNLENQLLQIDNATLNGPSNKRLYNVSNILIKGIDADALMMKLSNLMFSNGSACTSTILKPSHVLHAMGLSENESYSSIRISFSHLNSPDDIQTICNLIKKEVTDLKSMC